MRLVPRALAVCSVPVSALAQADAEAFDPGKFAPAERSSSATPCGSGTPPTPAAPTSDDAQAAKASLSPDDAVLLRTARRIAAMRSRRAKFLRAELFAEPAWDMLLDLYIAHLEGRRIYVTSLCIAANVPNTTALRYIQEMLRNGEIMSAADPHDGRRRWLWPSDQTVTAMGDIMRASIAPKA